MIVVEVGEGLSLRWVGTLVEVGEGLSLRWVRDCR